MRLGLVVCLALAACDANNTRRGNADGGPGGGGDQGPLSGDTCSAQAKLVYLVDENDILSSFAPDTLTFNNIGLLQCPAQLLATPFSMAVDRSATAWVLYSSGELFQVDTSTAHCTATAFAQSNGFQNFGMGFAANSSGSSDETLFIAGGASLAAGMGSSTLATLDLGTFNATKVGPIQLWPELTGTGDANLWGFFPSATTPKVSQLDKTSGADLQVFMAPTLAGQPAAWAFAFWGGDFWIFLKKSGDSSTNVYHMKSSDGSVSVAVPNTNRTIVGAGVSTCAPISIM
jgi:hypothetical protein